MVTDISATAYLVGHQQNKGWQISAETTCLPAYLPAYLPADNAKSRRQDRLEDMLLHEILFLEMNCS